MTVHLVQEYKEHVYNLSAPLIVENTKVFGVAVRCQMDGSWTARWLGVRLRKDGKPRSESLRKINPFADSEAEQDFLNDLMVESSRVKMLHPEDIQYQQPW